MSGSEAEQHAKAMSGSEAPRWIFALAGLGESVFATGLRERLPSGPADSLAERVAQFYQARETIEIEGIRKGDGGMGRAQIARGQLSNAILDPTQTHANQPILVGAIPFDREKDDFLFAPEAFATMPLPSTLLGHHNVQLLNILSDPTRAHYCGAVSKALELIIGADQGAEHVDKVVLSRSLLLQASTLINPLALWARLEEDPAVARFLTSLPNGADGDPRYLVGATPELLLSKQGGVITSHPLAGSARRRTDKQQDRSAAETLLRSGKDLREHQWVVEAIMDALSPLCRTLHAPPAPALVSTATMWHLGTRITGELRDAHAHSSAGLAALLHPTPAVGGYPRRPACRMIHDLEGYDRGFYAGAHGWTNSQGDGSWYVSLRCAEISGQEARIYAGAGVVDGSVPEAEADETSAKLQAILQAFGIDEAGQPLVNG